MFARTFEALSYLNAVQKAHAMGMFGQLMPVGPRLWMIYSN